MDGLSAADAAQVVRERVNLLCDYAEDDGLALVEVDHTKAEIWEALDSLVAAVGSAERERDEARAALARYGEHRRRCSTQRWMPEFGTEPVCDCGFDAARVGVDDTPQEMSAQQKTLSAPDGEAGSRCAYPLADQRECCMWPDCDCEETESHQRGEATKDVTVGDCQPTRTSAGAEATSESVVPSRPEPNPAMTEEASGSDPGSAPAGRCVMDFPSAWAYVRETDPADHHPHCSWRTQNGALLCDCDVLNDEYHRREVAMLWAYTRAEPSSGSALSGGGSV